MPKEKSNREVHFTRQALCEGVQCTFEGFPKGYKVTFKQHDSHGLELVVKVYNDKHCVSGTCVSPDPPAEESEFIIIGDEIGKEE